MDSSDARSVTDGAILGVNLDGTTLHVGSVRNGRLETRFFQRISADAEESVILQEIFATIERVMGSDVVGIGFGVPSVVDTETGVVRQVQNIPSWREVRLKDALERHFEVPCYVDNDANAFVVGELHFGAGRGVRNLVGIILGTGLGLGLVYDGKLCNGSHCGAGEIGRLPYREHDFEHFGSLKYFARTTNLREVLLRSRAEKGNDKARAVYTNYGAHLGRILQTVVYAYDPGMIVFGGPLAAAFPLFQARMHRSLAKGFAYPHTLESLRIEATQQTDGPILGAAALYLDSQLRKRGGRDTSG